MTTPKRECLAYLRWYATSVNFCVSNPILNAAFRSDIPIKSLLRWTSLRYFRNAKFPRRRGTPHISVDPHYPRVMGTILQNESGETLDHTFTANIVTLAPVIYVKFTAITFKTTCASTTPYFTVTMLQPNAVISTFAEAFDDWDI